MTEVIKVCPNCGAKSFCVTAHVTQDWVVDEKGNFLRATDECVEVTHRPDDDDIWSCNNCGHSAPGREFNATVEEKASGCVKLIAALIAVDTDLVTDIACQHTLRDAISQELKVLQDSGMKVRSWSFVEEEDRS